MFNYITIDPKQDLAEVEIHLQRVNLLGFDKINKNTQLEKLLKMKESRVKKLKLTFQQDYVLDEDVQQWLDQQFKVVVFEFIPEQVADLDIILKTVKSIKENHASHLIIDLDKSFTLENVSNILEQAKIFDKILLQTKDHQKHEFADLQVVIDKATKQGVWLELLGFDYKNMPKDYQLHCREQQEELRA